MMITNEKPEMGQLTRDRSGQLWEWNGHSWNRVKG